MHSSKGDYIVVQTDYNSFDKSDYETLPSDYSKMDYEDIQQIQTEFNPLPHWEDIEGMFSRMQGETLRFIISTQIPLKKFIRYELASRGYDQNFQWIGFEKAKDIWLK